MYGLDGFGAPYFYNEGPQTKLLGGCITGQIYLWDVPSISTNSCTLIDSTANGILEPTYSTPWYEDINGDGKPDLFIGNSGGGVSFYSSKAPDVSVKDNFVNENSVRVYPNPATDVVMIESAEGFVSIKEIELTNMLGQKIKFEKVNKHMCELQMADVPEGIYFIRITQQLNEQTFITTKKIIKR